VLTAAHCFFSYGNQIDGKNMYYSIYRAAYRTINGEHYYDGASGWSKLWYGTTYPEVYRNSGTTTTTTTTTTAPATTITTTSQSPPLPLPPSLPPPSYLLLLDWAIIKLDEPLGEQQGYLGINPTDLRNQLPMPSKFELIGYSSVSGGSSGSSSTNSSGC